MDKQPAVLEKAAAGDSMAWQRQYRTIQFQAVKSAAPAVSQARRTAARSIAEHQRLARTASAKIRQMAQNGTKWHIFRAPRRKKRSQTR
jgi:hypothetical protein